MYRYNLIVIIKYHFLLSKNLSSSIINKENFTTYWTIDLNKGQLQSIGFFNIWSYINK